MVTRNQLVTGIGMAVVLFASIQMYLHYKAPRHHPVELVRQRSSAYNMLQTFLNHCEESEVHCILVDPWILRALVEETWDEASNNPCRHFCRNHIYTFAIRDSDFQILKMDVLRVLTKAGYTVNAKFSESVQSDIPTHINLRYHENHAIHLVILHNRGGWWWYGPDNEDKFNLDFTKHEGALDEFDYDFKVTLDGLNVYMPHFPKRFINMYDNSYFIPCNKTRADLFYKQYPKDTGRNATEFRAVATKAIKLIKSRLDEYGVPFWLSSGTLLGWFRQCDFIPYSLDVDIGVFIKDHTHDLLTKLKQSSLMLEHKFGKIEDSLQYAFDMGKLKLDIFFFYEDKVTGKVWNGGTDYNTGEKFKYVFDKFSLCWTALDGRKVRVPCDTETYIKANYGDNWLTPVKEWDWRKSPPNVLPNGEWDDNELDDVIQLWDKKGKRINLEWEKEEL